jgi:hypothetical protein
MKKAAWFLVFLGLGSIMFAYDGFQTFAFGFGNSFEKRFDGEETKRIYNGIIGFDWNQYHLWNNAGLFVNFNFSGPMTTDTDNFYCYFQFGNMLGPAVKFDINDKIKLNAGAGFSYQIMVAEYDATTMTNAGFGIGADLCLAIFVNKATNISVGTTAQFHFSNVDDADGWTKRYSMAGLRPYVGISFYLSDLKFWKDALLL